MTVKYPKSEDRTVLLHLCRHPVLVQVVVGIIAAIQFLNPDIFILNFNTIRTLHINALVVWLAGRAHGRDLLRRA